ncbi:hypothetical protein [Chryseobacterium gambrini]|uniref:Uncharacterized protein n=1 Tax=Chryseobacterium gambrini TaxID=373672 RepID=A0A1N7PZZ9_9FLAO|nr:hypothetical protein [Chryseobacterium gambrini]SIT16213.1 hypothetical protein SAMN05421785_10881 [Chryseobacterium gambrini]
MKSIRITLGVAAIALGTFAAFSFGPKDKEVTKNETKAPLYWFDATTNAYIGHSESSGCDLSNSNPCEVGYAAVANPSNPQRPSGTPDRIDTGEKQ